MYYGLYENPYANRLFVLKPQTDEERLAIKRNWSFNYWDRDWELGEYDNDIQPKYDTYRRRQKYPEYYGDKYNTFKKYQPIF